MKPWQAWVFEVYRYGVCFIMLLTFFVSALGVLAGLATGATSWVAQLPSALGVILSGALFALHWRLKNPGERV